MSSKHIEQEFDARLEDLLFNQYDARLCDDDERYQFIVSTCAGDLLVQPHGTWVAMRFVDIESAKDCLPYGFNDPLNPYSGKYNAQSFNKNDSLETRINHVRKMIDKVF